MGEGALLSAGLKARRAREVFDANRAHGRIVFSTKSVGGKSRRDRVHESGSLRIRCPGAPSAELEAVLVNTAGGIAGGDQFTFDLTAGPGARLVVTSAAAEKVYRAIGQPAAIDLTMTVADGGGLTWLPHETILFDGARLRRRIDIKLSANASLLMAECVVFGRAAMGEVVRQGALFDSWRVRRDGRLLFAESLRLDGDIAARLGEPAAGNGAVALATVLAAPGDDDMLSAVRESSARFTGEVAMSTWNGVAVVRMLAVDAAALRADLAIAVSAMRRAPLPRLWAH